jgi:2-oxoglutarate ferredoxin oxidoreductase subunit beta
VKIANPDLHVLVVGGDGDGLGIGGGHLPHAIRRNVDLTYILFDNGIYGLTKGQSSPTTPAGQITGTHPYGNPDEPLDPVLLGLGYRAGFLGHGYAGEPDHLKDIFVRALSHRGFSFVPVLTPCVTFDAVNYTWDNLRGEWEPIPADHDPEDLNSALRLALDDRHYYGVFFEERDRPTFEDNELATREKAGG